MNVFRIPLNAYWWNSDVLVPLAGMGYKAWIQQVVKLLEAQGDYVILSYTTQFHTPPCGGNITYCPPQSQGGINCHPNPDCSENTSGKYTDEAVAMWKELASLYKNDPAVLYNIWNEMWTDNITWYNSENTLINTVRTIHPTSLIFLGGPDFNNDINAIIAGAIPDFTQPNLVYDFHIYDGACGDPLGYLYTDWNIHPNHLEVNVGYTQAHHHAAIIGEWGGQCDTEPYNADITTYAQAHNVSLIYYNQADMFTGNFQINANGLLVQKDYAS